MCEMHALITKSNNAKHRFWNRQGIMKPGPGSRFRLHITI